MTAPGREASNAAAAALWRAGIVFLGLLALPAAAQAPADALGAERVAAEAAHLWRVGAWGAANVAAGTALWQASDRDTGRRAFGVQSAAWGVINVGIAAVGLAAAGDAPAGGLAEALRAEGRLGDVLWVNMGLNAGYVAVGTTLYAVGARAGVARPEVWKGHGAAVVLQGVGLLVLDGVALAASHDRAGRLLDLVGVAPGGLGVVVPL